MSKTFSVVTPTCNSERYLEETINSVVSQSGDFYIEYIIIDNNSTDATQSIVERYIQRLESGDLGRQCKGVSIKYISESDKGMYDALSKGMQISTGEYFSYINSDDYYLENTFSKLLLLFESDVSWVTGLPGLIDKNSEYRASETPCWYKRSYIPLGVYGTLVPHIQQESTFWKRELLSLIDLKVLSSFQFAGDFYLWTTFSMQHQLYTANEFFAGFRWHDNNKSSDMQSYNIEFKSLVGAKPGLIVVIKMSLMKFLFNVSGNMFVKAYKYVISV